MPQKLDKNLEALKKEYDEKVKAMKEYAEKEKTRLKELQELYEKEVALREACRKYIDTLLLAYDNTVHSNERDLLAAEILDTMRARPSHEDHMHRQTGARPSYFRAGYDMLIAKLSSKERLVSQMVHMQVQSERRVTARALNQQNLRKPSSTTRNRSRVASSFAPAVSSSAPLSVSGHLASIFEVSLTMGNCARFFPLWNAVLSRIT